MVYTCHLRIQHLPFLNYCSNGLETGYEASCRPSSSTQYYCSRPTVRHTTWRESNLDLCRSLKSSLPIKENANRIVVPIILGDTSLRFTKRAFDEAGKGPRTFNFLPNQSYVGKKRKKVGFNIEINNLDDVTVTIYSHQGGVIRWRSIENFNLR